MKDEAISDRDRRSQFTLIEDQDPGLTYYCAAFFLTVIVITTIAYAFASAGFDPKSVHATGWTIIPIFCVFFVLPAVAVRQLLWFFRNLVGKRPFERTVWALMSATLFAVGFYDTWAARRVILICAGIFFISLQTLAPNWTLSGAWDCAEARFFARLPKLAWIDKRWDASASFQTKCARCGAVLAMMMAIPCLTIMPIFYLGLSIAGGLSVAFGLALIGIAFLIGQSANDGVWIGPVHCKQPDQEFCDFDDIPF